jgi:hypothetical protein
MITHRSCLEALAIPHAADAFDFLADLWLLPNDPERKAKRVGVEYHPDVGYHLEVWHDYSVDLSHMHDSKSDDGRIAGVTERAVQEKMDI